MEEEKVKTLGRILALFCMVAALFVLGFLPWYTGESAERQKLEALCPGRDFRVDWWDGTQIYVDDLDLWVRADAEVLLRLCD